MVLECATIDEIRDMFLRLQNGTPLTAQQKRDAIGSSIGRIARDIAEMPFFVTSVNFGNTQSEHSLVASQMLMLELKDKIVSCTSRQLDKIYEHYRKATIDSVVVGRTKQIVSILGKIFPDKNQHLNQNYALSLYWLVSRIAIIYDIPINQYGHIKTNFEKLDVNRIEAMQNDYKQTDDGLYEDLSLAMSRGNTGIDGISTRHDILGRFIFDGVDLILHQKLDPNRNFTYEEKLLLYHKANGCCQIEYNGVICGRSINFDEAVVDHITPHSLGGKTELANGRIAFKSCNIARGNRSDFDPATKCHLIAPEVSVGTQDSSTPGATDRLGD